MQPDLSICDREPITRLERIQSFGFLLAMTIFFTSHNPAVTFMAVLLAVLVAQSRVEAGVHYLREVVLGAVLAIFLTSLVYWVMPRVHALMGRPGQANAKVSSVPPERERRTDRPVV